jgi:hypothetical protein
MRSKLELPELYDRTPFESSSILLLFVLQDRSTQLLIDSFRQMKAGFRAELKTDLLTMTQEVTDQVANQVADQIADEVADKKSQMKSQTR